MILASLIFGGIIAMSVVGLIRIFWNDILSFMQKAILKARQMVTGIIEGAKILIQKAREGIKEISRNYSKENGHWQETTVTRTIPESQVPDDIRAKAAYSEATDITDQMELVLENAG